jgi:hypothetical protein
MKKLILLLLLSFPLGLLAQSTISPDTVCYQSSGSVYTVTNDPNNTYTWTVASPGVLVNGQGTNSITVNWNGANPGLIANAVTVFPTNQYGCVGPTVNMNVFVLNVIPVVTPVTVCFNEPCVTLTGTPAGGTWSGPGIVGNTFCSSVSGVGNFTATYTYTLAGCTFTATGVITVNPLPTISPISHN